MKVDFQKALSLLKAGEVVAIPTETVYGLAARIDSEKAIKTIFQLKKRPRFNPLIVHCYNSKQALSYVSQRVSIVQKLFDNFCPGPLSIVIKKNKKISSLITAGQTTVALRIPKHPITRKLLKELDIPLAAPSANPYGKTSPVSSQHVLSAFKNKVPVLEGGLCKKGLESTLVQVDMKKKILFILRLGMITKKQLENFLMREKLTFRVEYKQEVFQPGASLSHYQPSVPFYIIESQKPKKEIQVFLSNKYPHKVIKELKLFPSGQKTARVIYSELQELSKHSQHLIYVQKKSRNFIGLWKTIWDRLEKASLKTIKYGS